MADINLSEQQIHDENQQVNDLHREGDDRPAPQSRQPAEREGDDAPRSGDIPIGSQFQDKRAAIYAKQREIRENGEADSEFRAVPPAREKDIFGLNVETPADREARRAAERGDPPADQQPPAKKRLLVNGQAIEVDDAQLVEHAQRSIAAGDILGQAKAARDEAFEALRTVREVARGDQPPASRGQQQQVDTQTPENQRAKGIDLKEVVDLIQVGSPEEAQGAFQKVIDNVRESVREEMRQIPQQIRAEEVAVQRRRAADEMITGFARDNQDFAANQSLMLAVAAEGMSRMRSILAEQGVQESSLERLRQEHNLDEPGVIGFAYRTLQERGHQLPDHRTILDESAGSIRQAMGLPARRAAPAPAPTNLDVSQRVERKRDIAMQPRRAMTPTPADRVEMSRVEKQRDAVAQMRFHRSGGRR